MIAGNDTTSTVMSWGFKLLADAQLESQSTLRHRLHAAHSAALAEGRTPTAAEIVQTNIPYLDAVIEELLRCAGAVPFHERQAINDTVVLGYHIPKGTTVLMPTFGPSMTGPALRVGKGPSGDVETGDKEGVGKGKRDHGASFVPREWPDHETANIFRPERWLKHGAEIGKDVFDAQAGPTMPFGVGLRGCFGPKFAHLEMRVLVTVLLWNFELMKCPEELSGYTAVDDLFHKPRDCYVKVRSLWGGHDLEMKGNKAK